MILQSLFAISDHETNTALHLASIHSFYDLVQTLLEHGAPANIYNRYLCTPLHLACLDDNLVIVKTLIKHGADPTARAQDQSTALHWAAYYGNIDIVYYLLNQPNVDINARDAHNKIPAVYALENDQIRTALYLIEQGSILPDNIHQYQEIYHIIRQHFLTIARKKYKKYPFHPIHTTRKTIEKK